MEIKSYEVRRITPERQGEKVEGVCGRTEVPSAAAPD